MAEQLTVLPHDFDFIEDNRPALTFTGSIRLNPDLQNGAGAVQLRADANNEYPTTGVHYVVSELYAPRAVRQWLGFQVDVEHQLDDGVQMTGDGYRLGDGTSQYYWDGVTWSLATLDAHWSTEAQIATNIGTFPPTARQLQAVVRLTTTNKHRTPILRAVRVAWIGKVEAFEDIVYRSLVPLLGTVRPITDFAIKVAIPGGLNLNVMAAVNSSGLGFEVIDLDGVFNNNLDPDCYDNLLSSYNPATGIATLSTAIPVGQYALVRLKLKPQVSILATAQDYIEVEKVPALQIKDIAAVDSQPLSVETAVVNKGTGDIIVIPPPYRFNLRFTMIALTPGGVDLMRILRAVVNMVEGNPTITSRATGKRYRFWMTDEFTNTTTPQDNNLHSSQASFEIRDVLSFERPAVFTKAVGNFNLNIISI